MGVAEARLDARRLGDRHYQLDPQDQLKALRRADAKLVAFPAFPRAYLELYELGPDPRERNNVVAERPEVTRQMLSRLAELLGDLPIRRNDTWRPPGIDEEEAEILRSLGYVE